MPQFIGICMKVFNKILLLLMLLSGLHILVEELISKHEPVSMEVNIEIQKEEKENKDECYDLNQDSYFPIKRTATYNIYTNKRYKNPIIAVPTSPPEA